MEHFKANYIVARLAFFGLFSGDFSGCSEIHLYAKDHRIWMSKQHKFATSPRNESYIWSEQVPNNLLSLVKKFALMHSRC
uniref:Secreted protein n=1 Tax=Ditylenchus dipsaci TaxID=166011 RepID=A0A915E4G5_9BILA